MVEELRAIFQILGDTTLQLGEYALWAGGGFIFLKLATLASYLALARYAISRIFNYLGESLLVRKTRSKELGQEIQTGDMIKIDDDIKFVNKTYKKGDELMLLVHKDRLRSDENLKYCSIVKASSVELIG